VLLILMDNALKYTPEGGFIRVGVDRPTGGVRLWVQDSGPGIAAADLPHLFERFYRADRARTGDGTGLGLAIASWIVEAHGGRISAGNVTPQGALFTVNLPAMG
jgi:signal transduction histidine kinase